MHFSTQHVFLLAFLLATFVALEANAQLKVKDGAFVLGECLGTGSYGHVFQAAIGSLDAKAQVRHPHTTHILQRIAKKGLKDVVLKVARADTHLDADGGKVNLAMANQEATDEMNRMLSMGKIFAGRSWKNRFARYFGHFHERCVQVSRDTSEASFVDGNKCVYLVFERTGPHLLRCLHRSDTCAPPETQPVRRLAWMRDVLFAIFEQLYWLTEHHAVHGDLYRHVGNLLLDAAPGQEFDPKTRKLKFIDNSALSSFADNDLEAVCYAHADFYGFAQASCDAFDLKRLRPLREGTCVADMCAAVRKVAPCEPIRNKKDPDGPVLGISVPGLTYAGLLTELRKLVHFEEARCRNEVITLGPYESMFQRAQPVTSPNAGVDASPSVVSAAASSPALDASGVPAALPAVSVLSPPPTKHAVVDVAPLDVAAPPSAATATANKAPTVLAPAEAAQVVAKRSQLYADAVGQQENMKQQLETRAPSFVRKAAGTFVNLFRRGVKQPKPQDPLAVDATASPSIAAQPATATATRSIADQPEGTFLRMFRRKGAGKASTTVADASASRSPVAQPAIASRSLADQSAAASRKLADEPAPASRSIVDQPEGTYLRMFQRKVHTSPASSAA